MTILDTHLDTAPALTSENTVPAPLYRINPWRNKAIYAGTATAGVGIAALVTAFLTPGMAVWAGATFATFVLLTAWCIAGFELREQNPIYTDRI